MQKSAPAQPPTMLTIAFFENGLNGVSDKEFSRICIPVQIPKERKGRLIISEEINVKSTEIMIPSRGVVSIRGTPITALHKFEYSHVPCVRSSVVDRLSPEEDLPVRDIIPDISSEFEGWAELPTSTWIQLNSPKDPYTVQVNLIKVHPSDKFRSRSRREYFVYTVCKIAVTLPPEATVAEEPFPQKKLREALATVKHQESSQTSSEVKAIAKKIMSGIPRDIAAVDEI